MNRILNYFISVKCTEFDNCIGVVTEYLYSQGIPAEVLELKGHDACAEREHMQEYK